MERIAAQLYDFALTGTLGQASGDQPVSQEPDVSNKDPDASSSSNGRRRQQTRKASSTGASASLVLRGEATVSGLPLSSSLPVTPAPDVASLLCGLHLQSVDRIRGFRPSGTTDWLMVSTVRGRGYCRAGNGCWPLSAGDILLIAPGTPQEYGYVDDDSDWVNIWVHFRPRPHWLPWLAWPEVSKGLMILQTGENFGPIEAELRLLIEVSKQPRRLWHDRALNRLERVLIDCDDVNPLHSASSVDKRIRRALELVGKNLASPLGVEELSQAAGLSRSRFTVLFTEQTKMSPQAYIEFVRLSKAAQLLQMSAWPISRIAEEIGIPSPFYFSTRFRQRFGVSPSVYRQRHSLAGSAAERP